MAKVEKLTADDLIFGYMNGIFPMSDSDGVIFWYSPEPRAIIPIDTYRPHKSLRPFLNKAYFEIAFNKDFEGVMRGCSMPRVDEEETWISEEIIQAYCELHRLGKAHSVEAYRNGKLVGGLYGVSLGTVFFGESMFYIEPNASKVAFHFLIEQLRKQGFELLDTQFINDNVRRFGAIEIPRADYLNLLKDGLMKEASFL